MSLLFLKIDIKTLDFDNATPVGNENQRECIAGWKNISTLILILQEKKREKVYTARFTHSNQKKIKIV